MWGLEPDPLLAPGRVGSSLTPFPPLSWRGGRTVVVVITDGQSQERAGVVERAAAALKSTAPMTVIAVGVTEEVSRTELETIASSPELVTIFETFEQAKTEVGLLSRSAQWWQPCRLLPSWRRRLDSTNCALGRAQKMPFPLPPCSSWVSSHPFSARTRWSLQPSMCTKALSCSTLAGRLTQHHFSLVC